MINWFDLPVFLGSKSPRRKALLEQIGISFSVLPGNFDETNYNHINDPEKFARKVAIAKGKDLLSKMDAGWIITADTIVVIDDRILGKPADREEAAGMLRILSNRTHHVYTGLAITNASNARFISGVEKTAVTFKKISDAEIDFYIDNYKPFDKAGSYGIQDYSAVFCSRIEGCFYNVVGFPLHLFYSLATTKLEGLL